MQHPQAPEAQPDSDLLVFEVATDLLAREIPDPLWHVDDMIAGGGCTMVPGTPKSAKSLLMLDLAVATATGGKWLGRKVNCPGTVLLMDCETSARRMKERIERLRKGRGLLRADLGNLHVLRSPPPLLNRDENLNVLRALVWSEEPALVIVDPLIRFHDLEENSAAEMSTLLTGLRSLTQETGTTLVVVHHMSKVTEGRRLGQAIRGTSDFHGWYDSAIGVTRDGQELALSFEARDCPDQPDLNVLLEVDDEVMRFREVGPSAFKAAKADKILDLLQRHPDGLTVGKIRAEARCNDVIATQALGELRAAGLVEKQRSGRFDVWLHSPQNDRCCTPEGAGSAGSAGDSVGGLF
jgi:hypothetical protein